MDAKSALRLAQNRQSYWKFQAIGWLSFCLTNLLGSLPGILDRKDTFRAEIVPAVWMFLGSCALHPVCRRLLRQSQSWVTFESKVAGASCAISIATALGTGLTMQSFNHSDWYSVVSYWVWSSFVLFMWCSLYFSIKQWQQSIEEKQRLLRAETEVRDARLLALRYQLNPHFLFNSLNAVSTLILDGKGPAATEMLAQIGDLLRSSLDSDVKSEIMFSDEIEFTERYLAIEQTRLGDRLKFELAVAAETRDAMVPSMLLQPLVENAVRYGISPLIEGGWIAISSSLQSDRLQIVIANSGDRKHGEQRTCGNGVGLGNTESRLKTLYGNDYSFSLEWPESGGCRATVAVPHRTSDSEEKQRHARIDH